MYHTINKKITLSLVSALVNRYYKTKINKLAVQIERERTHKLNVLRDLLAKLFTKYFIRLYF